MNEERKDITETRYINIGDLVISFVGNLDSDIEFLLSAIRSQVGEQIQELKEAYPTGGINSKPREFYVDHIASIEIAVTRSETDAEYGARLKREKAKETANLAKAAKQKVEDIKALTELTKRLGVEVVGGIPVAPVLPKEKEAVKKPKRRSPRW